MIKLHAHVSVNTGNAACGRGVGDCIFVIGLGGSGTLLGVVAIAGFAEG